MVDDVYLHCRIYDDEVIELSPEVSLILLLPPPDSVCAVAGQSEALFPRPEFLSVPVQVFEMIHLRTYQRDLIGRYSRLSSLLELDSNLAQLSMREVRSVWPPFRPDESRLNFAFLAGVLQYGAERGQAADRPIAGSSGSSRRDMERITLDHGRRFRGQRSDGDGGSGHIVSEPTTIRSAGTDRSISGDTDRRS